MENIKFETSQNVELEFPQAGIGDRAIAAIIDFVVRVLYWIGLAFIIGALGLQTDIGTVFIYLMVFPTLLYQILFEYFMNGQTPGKKMLKIQVKRLDGLRPTFGAYFIRWLLSFVDYFLFGVGIIAIVISKNNQRLGDMAAGTTVVRIDRPVDFAHTTYTEIDDSPPKYPNTDRLSDDDAVLIRDIINAYYSSDERDLLVEGIYKAKNHYESKLQVKSESDAMQFLRDLLSDYNKYHGRI
ncbi:MAG: RDD family protein [Bacteroidota bacterium]